MENLGSVEIEFILLCASGSLGLEVAITLGTVMVHGLNLVGPFSNGNFSVSKKLSVDYFSPYVRFVGASYKCFFFAIEKTSALF